MGVSHSDLAKLRTVMETESENNVSELNISLHDFIREERKKRNQLLKDMRKSAFDPQCQADFALYHNCADDGHCKLESLQKNHGLCTYKLVGLEEEMVEGSEEKMVEGSELAVIIKKIESTEEECKALDKDENKEFVKWEKFATYHYRHTDRGGFASDGPIGICKGDVEKSFEECPVRNWQTMVRCNR